MTSESTVQSPEPKVPGWHHEGRGSRVEGRARLASGLSPFTVLGGPSLETREGQRSTVRGEGPSYVSRFTFHAPRSTPGRRQAFTLIELMVVIGIMGIIVAMGIPTIYRVWHREPMSKAVNDVQEVCSNARARAILQGAMTEVIFHPRELRLEVAGAAPARVEPQPGPGSEDTPPPPPANSGLSAQISDRLFIEMLDVNLTEYKDEELARVRFYPNGTADEMTLILHSDKNEWCKISLEVTTGLTSVEFDPRLFR